MNTGSHGRSNTPLRVSVVHTHIHEHITDEAVAVGRAVVEDGAHHGVVEVVGRGVGDGLHHEHGIPEHVGVRRVDIAVDGVFHFGAELAEREHKWKTENNEGLLQHWQLQTNSYKLHTLHTNYKRNTGDKITFVDGWFTVNSCSFFPIDKSKLKDAGNGN